MAATWRAEVKWASNAHSASSPERGLAGHFQPTLLPLLRASKDRHLVGSDEPAFQRKGSKSLYTAKPGALAGLGLLSGSNVRHHERGQGTHTGWSVCASVGSQELPPVSHGSEDGSFHKPHAPFPSSIHRKEGAQMPLPYSSQVLPARAGSDRGWGQCLPSCVIEQLTLAESLVWAVTEMWVASGMLRSLSPALWYGKTHWTHSFRPGC